MFSSGEAEINDVCEGLRRHEPDLEVLPLYARLATREQQRVFSPSSGRRRVIVATNVAETSLTVPGIRYVVDLGEARMSRFSQRTKVQRLPIEAVSQASANQRSGRCGRLGAGIAIRCFAEDDFDQRPEFTEPEIQRTNLATVILTMADQGLGSPADFPFIDPPDPRAVTDGARLLHELGAVESATVGGDRSWLTETGARLAVLPIDPRLGRIVLGGDTEGCLSEATIIAAGLAVQDPRERPRERQAAADEAHRQFAHPTSDFLSLVRLFHVATEQRRELTRRKFGRWCRDNFLHAQRMIEWFDTVNQIKDGTDSLGIAPSWSSHLGTGTSAGTSAGSTAGTSDSGSRDPVEGEDVHRCVLYGLMSQVGMRIERSHEYLGPRSTRFAIQPGSACFERRPDWIVAATLVETSRLWARTVAPIDPRWLEEPAAHLTTVELGDIEWDVDRAQATTSETVRLYGLPIVGDRIVPLDRHDPAHARELFITCALIEGDWDRSGNGSRPWPALAANEAIRREARNLKARSQRASFDDEHERLRTFYDKALAPHVTSAIEFEQWFVPAAQKDPDLLGLGLADLVEPADLHVDEASFPDRIEHGGLVLDIDYAPGTLTPAPGTVNPAPGTVNPAPGTVSPGAGSLGTPIGAGSLAVDLPLTAIGQIDPTSFVGVVPGHRRAAVIALLRGFPKPLRKQLVPIPGTVDSILAEIGERPDFALALRVSLERLLGEPAPVDALDPRTLPPALRPQYRIVNDDGVVLARGHDLAELRVALGNELASAFGDGAEGVTHPGATSWEFGTIARKVSLKTRQGSTTAWPGLVDMGETVGVELYATPEEQARATWLGTRRLLRLTVASPLREMNRVFDPKRLLALELSPHGERREWFEDLTLACLGMVIDQSGVPWSAAEFASLQKRARADVTTIAQTFSPVAAEILDETAAIRMTLAALDRVAPDCVNDARHHLERLTFPGHFAAVGLKKLDDVLRYLRGISHRLERLPSRVGADRESMHQALVVEDAYETIAAHVPWSIELESISWSLEELRVSMFAQHLGTTERVSPNRIRRRLERLAAA